MDIVGKDALGYIVTDDFVINEMSLELKLHRNQEY